MIVKDIPSEDTLVSVSSLAAGIAAWIKSATDDGPLMVGGLLQEKIYSAGMFYNTQKNGSRYEEQ